MTSVNLPMPVGKLQNRAIATFPLVLAVSVGFAGVAVCACATLTAPSANTVSKAKRKENTGARVSRTKGNTDFSSSGSGGIVKLTELRVVAQFE